MKKLIFCFTLTLVSLTMYATGQEGDIIYIDGTQWELLGKPIYADTLLSRKLKEALPKERGWATSNWSGYTAYWSIQQEQLCLDSVQYKIYDGSSVFGRTESLSSDTLLHIFSKYISGGHIVATWLKDDIRVARGKQLYYVHSGYNRNYEHEQIISINNGKVCDVKDYDNYVIEGLSFDKYRYSDLTPDNIMQDNNAYLRELFPLHIENYPELVGVKRILFNIKKARVDANGNLVECEVRVLKPNDNPRLAAEMADLMKAYHPWRVSYINGEFRGYGIEGYTFPYILEEQ